MAKVAAPAGSVIEETKRTRVLPGNSPDADGDKPWRLLDTWEYLASLAPDQWTREDITVYLYRYDEKGSRWGIGKYTSAIDEFKVMEMFGGGRFNLVVKRRQQIIKNEDFQLEGPQKTPGVNGAPLAPGTAAPNSESALLTTINALVEELKAARGGTVLQDSIKNAIALNQSVFSAAMPAVTQTLQRVGGGDQPHAPGPMDEIVKQFMQAAITKMINPPAANSLEETLKLIQLFKGSGLLQSNDSKTSMALELVRQVPNVAQTLVAGVEHWRFAEEARARQAAIMRTGPQPINVPPAAPAQPANVISMPPPVPQQDAAPAPTGPTNTQADAAAVAAQEQVPATAMPIEALEQLICNIIVDPNLSLEQAATEACALIERVLPGKTDSMAMNGKENLLLFFRSRPILAQVANHPRLSDFLDKFIETVKAAPVMQAPNPTAPVA
jgi:hypothetical protein